MGSPKPGKTMAFYDAGETLADGGAGHVDELAGDEMGRRHFGADIDKAILGNAEFGQFTLRFDLGLGIMATHGLGDVLDLGHAPTQLQRVIAVAFGGFLGHHLTAPDIKHGHRHMGAVVSEQAGHADFAGNQTGTHDQ